jgi:hypothetical protein
MTANFATSFGAEVQKNCLKSKQINVDQYNTATTATNHYRTNRTRSDQKPLTNEDNNHIKTEPKMTNDEPIIKKEEKQITKKCITMTLPPLPLPEIDEIDEIVDNESLR